MNISQHKIAIRCRLLLITSFGHKIHEHDPDPGESGWGSLLQTSNARKWGQNIKHEKKYIADRCKYLKENIHVLVYNSRNNVIQNSFNFYFDITYWDYLYKLSNPKSSLQFTSKNHSLKQVYKLIINKLI